MIIKNIRFVKSCVDYKSCPLPDKPEFAFAGRSNVGKSSLINMLLQRKNIAQVSSYPGKTKFINYFLIDESWYLADLPGYGYARRSKENIISFQHNIKNYLLKRENLICLFFLIDSRHKPLKNDIMFLNWLGYNKIPFVICFTKIDKLSQIELNHNIEEYKDFILEIFTELPIIFLTSAEKKTGREEILNFMEPYIKNF